MSKNKLIKAQKEYIKMIEYSLGVHQAFVLTKQFADVNTQKEIDRGQKLRDIIKKNSV